MTFKNGYRRIANKLYPVLMFEYQRGMIYLKIPES